MIAIENLVKRHGAREVLHGVSLEARPGRVTGFVGPNGAGKSSTLRCLLGLDRADSGRALIGGRPTASCASRCARWGLCSTARARIPRARPAVTWVGWPRVRESVGVRWLRCSTSSG